MAYQQPIMLYKGTANTIKIVVFNSKQKVVDLTEYDVQIQIVDRETQEHFITKTGTIDTPTSGVATITFTESDLRDLDNRFYHIIARLTDPADESSIVGNEILYLDDNYGAFTPVTIENAWNFNPSNLPVSGPADLNLGNIIPLLNNTYSLGSSSYQWKDLYVSSSTIYLGGIPLSIDGTGNLTVNGTSISTTAVSAGTVTTAAQPNITSVGTLTSLGVSGTVTASRLVSNIATGTAPFTVTSTTQVANLNVAVAGTVTTAAQPNITSVGTLTSLAVSGNITLPNGAVIRDTAGDAVAFGQSAGETSQGVVAVAVGSTAGRTSQGAGAVAVGSNAGFNIQGEVSVAVGTQTGATLQGVGAVAIGYSTGFDSQGANAVAIGSQTGQTSQGASAVAVGSGAGYYKQSEFSVAIGRDAGKGGEYTATYVSGAYPTGTTLVVNSTTGIATGMFISGNGFVTDQTVVSVTNSTTLQISASADSAPSGTLTFFGYQGSSSVAVGFLAGETHQGAAAVAVGTDAGRTLQGVHAVAIGTDAGATSQGNRAVAIGYLAGSNNQGTESVAIGYYAGELNQANNSIIINATSTGLQQNTANTFTVAPIRNVGGTSGVLQYNAATKEVSYSSDITSEGAINIDINLSDSTLRRWSFGEDGNLEAPGGIQVAGILKVDDGVHEKFQTKADATGIVTHDCSLGHIFRHTSPDANWTANFTNLNLSSGYATAVTLIIAQGGTGYYPNVVQIGGAAQTINWQGNINPTVSTNRTDVVTFSIINNSGTYTVLGQLTGF